MIMNHPEYSKDFLLEAKDENLVKKENLVKEEKLIKKRKIVKEKLVKEENLKSINIKIK